MGDAAASSSAVRASAPIVGRGLASYRFGAGDPVLLMPGPHRFQRPGLRMADALINGLTAIGREVITFDPPGSGASTRQARLGMDEMIACTDEVLDRAGITWPLAAVGHSMGGFALLAYALSRPERVERLVLVGSGAGGYLGAPGALWNRSHPAFGQLALRGIVLTLWPRLGPETAARNLIERESFVDRRLARPQPIRARDWLRPPAGRTDWHKVARTLDYHDRLAELACPALTLVGRHDPQFPLACSERLAAGIRHSRLVVFERSGHYPFVEEPESFWVEVKAFLAPAASDGGSTATAPRQSAA